MVVQPPSALRVSIPPGYSFARVVNRVRWAGDCAKLLLLATTLFFHYSSLRSSRLLIVCWPFYLPLLLRCLLPTNWIVAVATGYCSSSQPIAPFSKLLPYRTTLSAYWYPISSSHSTKHKNRVFVMKEFRGRAVPSPVSLLSFIRRLNLVLTYGIPPEFRGGVHLFINIRHRISPEFIGSRICVPMSFTTESPPAQDQ